MPDDYELFDKNGEDRDPAAQLTPEHSQLLDEAAAGAGVAAGTPRVVFGEACRLSEMRRRALGIDFRQIPYDIRARQEAPAWR